jgi:outer membrane immunogenic protein
MKKLFLTIAALAILAGHPAAAADMRVPVYKALPPVYDPWAGGYVGINVGYSWGPWGASSNQPVFNFESLTASPKLNGWLGGVQAGHNWRVNGQWLLGIEGDVQITGEKAAQTWIDPELPPNLGETFAFVPRAGGPATLSHDWQLPWFATLRLRAGVTPIESWLLYVTGGLAVGGTRYSFSFSQPGAALNFPPTPTSYALSNRSTRVGFAAGLGSEVRLDLNWSLKLEYLFLDLGSVSIDTIDIDGDRFHVDYRVRDHILRIGLNYRFAGPVIAKY